MTDIEPFVQIEDLAKHLTVSVSTVRTWVRQGVIPRGTYIKVGSTYRFRVSAVTAALLDVQESPPLPGDDIDPQLSLDFTDPDADAAPAADA